MLLDGKTSDPVNKRLAKLSYQIMEPSFKEGPTIATHFSGNGGYLSYNTSINGIQLVREYGPGQLDWETNPDGKIKFVAVEKGQMPQTEYYVFTKDSKEA